MMVTGMTHLLREMNAKNLVHWGHCVVPHPAVMVLNGIECDE